MGAKNPEDVIEYKWCPFDTLYCCDVRKNTCKECKKSNSSERKVIDPEECKKSNSSERKVIDPEKYTKDECLKMCLRISWLEDCPFAPCYCYQIKIKDCTLYKVFGLALVRS